MVKQDVDVCAITTKKEEGVYGGHRHVASFSDGDFSRSRPQIDTRCIVSVQRAILFKLRSLMISDYKQVTTTTIDIYFLRLCPFRNQLPRFPLVN